MLTIILVFIAMLAIAVLCAIRLTRAAPASAVVETGEVESMKAALERRMREGAEFRF